jgi:hypothetical protein
MTPRDLLLEVVRRCLRDEDVTGAAIIEILEELGQSALIQEAEVSLDILDSIENPDDEDVEEDDGDDVAESE